MAEQVADITINFEEDGVLVIKELDKKILTKGTWSTIIFKYQQWEPAKEAYSLERYTIRRYRKVHGEYKQQSKFNISSKDQASQIIAALKEWINPSTDASRNQET